MDLPAEDGNRGGPAAPSKRSLKKLAKRQKYEENKAVKQGAKQAARPAEGPVPDEEGGSGPEDPEEAQRREQIREQRRLRKQLERERLKTGSIEVVIDCSFDEFMRPNEITSLGHQIIFSYGALKKMANPFRMHLVGLGGRDGTDGTDSTNGAPQDPVPNSTGAPNPASRPGDPRPASVPRLKSELNRITSNAAAWAASFHEGQLRDVFRDRLSDIVYLSADGEEEVASLQPGSIYVIGGLVDRNRHKNLCADRARALGLRCARLPLQRHVKLTASTVLATNHVFTLLSKVADGASWEEAIALVLPSRKVGPGGDPAGGSALQGTGDPAEVEGAGGAAEGDEEESCLPEDQGEENQPQAALAATQDRDGDVAPS